MFLQMGKQRKEREREKGGGEARDSEETKLLIQLSGNLQSFCQLEQQWERKGEAKEKQRRGLWPWELG